MGAIVSLARSKGELTKADSSAPAKCSAARAAILRPNGDRWYPGIQPYKTPVGLSTSPWRSRWTVVVAPIVSLSDTSRAANPALPMTLRHGAVSA